METIPVFYRAAIYVRRKQREDLFRREILGEPRDNVGQAIDDAAQLARETPAKVILVLRSDKWAINAGKFFLHQILK